MPARADRYAVQYAVTRAAMTSTSDSTTEPPPLRPPFWLRLAPLVFLLLWSGGYSAVKVGLEFIEPVWFLAVRYMVVLAVLLPAWLILRPPLPRTTAAWLHLAVVGALIQGLYFGGTNLAVKFGVSAAGLAIVLAMQPILVAILAPRLAGETVGWRVWLGLVIGLAGAGIAILAKSSAGEATASGIATAAIALVFITAGTIWEKRFGSPHHPVIANAVQCGVALVLAIPVALLTETTTVQWTPAFIASLAYLSIFNSIIAMTLLFAMIRHGAASRATALLFLVPPTSAAIAWLLLAEPMATAAWAGMLLAAIGVAIVRRT